MEMIVFSINIPYEAYIIVLENKEKEKVRTTSTSMELLAVFYATWIRPLVENSQLEERMVLESLVAFLPLNFLSMK